MLSVFYLEVPGAQEGGVQLVTLLHPPGEEEEGGDEGGGGGEGERKGYVKEKEKEKG